ncbi:MAG: DUF721 domain-containing protein [Myxococcota bacterium]|nr:DUF721 domain-containing protein [Myxococcota bacterium]
MSTTNRKTNAARFHDGVSSRGKVYRKKFTALGDIVARVLATTEGAPKRRKPSKALKVFDAFNRLGPPFTTHAEPRLFRNKILTLTVEESAWLTEMTFFGPEIVEKLNVALGAGTVSEVRARLGVFERTQINKEPPQAPKKKVEPPRLSPVGEEQLAELALEIKSPELRDVVQRAARWSLGKNKY